MLSSLDQNILKDEKQVRSVFVGNVPYDTTEEELKEIFCKIGPVLSFRIVHDRDTGKPKGYGFCEFRDVETAQSAIRNLNGLEFHNRTLRVDSAVNEKGREEFEIQRVQEVPGFVALNPGESAQETILRVISTMPPEQILELLKQTQACIHNNPDESRDMLIKNPQLSFALLHALLVMKLIDEATLESLIVRPGHIGISLPSQEGFTSIETFPTQEVVPSRDYFHSQEGFSSREGFSSHDNFQPRDQFPREQFAPREEPRVHQQFPVSHSIPSQFPQTATNMPPMMIPSIRIPYQGYRKNRPRNYSEFNNFSWDLDSIENSQRNQQFDEFQSLSNSDRGEIEFERFRAPHQENFARPPQEARNMGPRRGSRQFQNEYRFYGSREQRGAKSASKQEHRSQQSKNQQTHFDEFSHERWEKDFSQSSHQGDQNRNRQTRY